MSQIDKDNRTATWLRSRGWLCIPPGDPSPLGELVRAVFHAQFGPYGGIEQRAGWAIRDAGKAIKDDPAIRQWAERGRDG